METVNENESVTPRQEEGWDHRVVAYQRGDLMILRWVERYAYPKNGYSPWTTPVHRWTLMRGNTIFGTWHRLRDAKAVLVEVLKEVVG